MSLWVRWLLSRLPISCSFFSFWIVLWEWTIQRKEDSCGLCGPRERFTKQNMKFIDCFGWWCVSRGAPAIWICLVFLLSFLGGLWAAAAAIAPLKEENEKKKPNEFNEGWRMRVEWINQINLNCLSFLSWNGMEWRKTNNGLIWIDEWSPALSLSSTAPPIPFKAAEKRKASLELELGCWFGWERGGQLSFLLWVIGGGPAPGN